MKLILSILVCVIFVFNNTATAELKAERSEYTWKNGVFQLPLTIKDNSGVARTNWPVTSGVPLPYGLIKETSQLRLIDSSGNEIPCQFKVTSRYSARDRSIRWVLLDFQVDVAANGHALVKLTNDRPSTPIKNKIIISENQQGIHVNTGRLEIDIDKHNSNIFSQVSTGGFKIIQSGNKNGTFIKSGAINQAEHFQGPQWNNQGWQKSSTLENINIVESIYNGTVQNAKDVYIETSGPLRAVVVVKGKYLPEKSGSGIVKHGMYFFTIRIHFYHNHSFVVLEHAIENSDATTRPQWSYLFREAGLEHDLLFNKAIITGGDHTNPVAFNIDTSNSASLYQGPASQIKKYGKYKIVNGQYVIAKNSQPVKNGNNARFMDISDQQKGFAVSFRYFWEEAPRAIQLSPNKARIILHADIPPDDLLTLNKRPEYDLDFGERIIDDVLYYFHSGDARQANVANVVEGFQYPLFAYAPPAWYSDSETWYFEVSPLPANASNKSAQDKHWTTKSIGYNKHGYNRSYNSGGHHDSLNSGWLSYIRTGHLSELEKNRSLTRWSIAHNPGWVYQNNVLPDSIDKVDDFLKQWDQVAGYGPKDFYLWRSNEKVQVKTRKGVIEKFTGADSYFNKYKWLPDHEHYALFRIFEYYYLTGDQRALDAINGFVNWDLNFQHTKMFNQKVRTLDTVDFFEKDPDALKRGHYSRVYSWMLYSNLAGLHTTGNPSHDFFARWQIRRLLALLRHRHGQPTNWYKSIGETGGIFDSNEPVYLSRAQSWMDAQVVLAMHEAYKTYHDERILDGIWGLADYFSNHVIYFPKIGMMNNRTSMPNSLLGYGKGKDSSLNPRHHDRYLQAFPLLYHYTGWDKINKRYKGILSTAKKMKTRDWYLQTGYWQELNKKKLSSSPPDRITDLSVISTNDNGIQIRWTSPKDDGPQKRAKRYFLKYSNKPIVEFAPSDNPARFTDINKIVNQADELVIKRSKGKKILAKHLKFIPEDTGQEPANIQRWHPDWNKKVAFWMAEHITGEPDPAPAGTVESFTITHLNPSSHFGLNNGYSVKDLPAGTYYLAICSWDEEQNLSSLSNVAEFRIK